MEIGAYCQIWAILKLVILVSTETQWTAPHLLRLSYPGGFLGEILGPFWRRILPTGFGGCNIGCVDEKDQFLGPQEFKTAIDKCVQEIQSMPGIMSLIHLLPLFSRS
tara:strand:- start:34 stop:354 length:321 start_codon:yes stop_codon:yes gene_type:complete